jgi:hypothetical protein
MPPYSPYDDLLDTILCGMKGAPPRHSDPDPPESSEPAMHLGYVVGADVPVQYRVLEDKEVKPMDH